MQRKRHDKDFKIQIAREAIVEGNAASVARQYGLSPTMVNRWVNEYKMGKYGVDTDTTISYKHLSHENEKLKQLLGEKDLKIAMLFDLIKNAFTYLLFNINKYIYFRIRFYHK